MEGMDQQRADELMIRALQGRATPGELEALEGWLRAGEERRGRFRQISEIWAHSGNPGRSTRPPSARDLLRRDQAGLVASGPDREPAAAAPRRGPARGAWGGRRRRWAPLVALVPLAAGFAGVLAVRHWSPPPGEMAVAAAEPFQAAQFRTGASDRVTVELSDGTVVHLGSSSELQVLEGEGREVRFRGEGFFAVAKDPHRPFRIRTDGGEARVLGTRFELRTSAGGVQATVVEGRVALAGDLEQVELGASQRATVVEGRPGSVELVDDVYASLAWMGRTLAFQETPLSEALREVEARYGVRVELTDVVLGRRTVSGTFQDRDAAEVVQVLCLVVRARCSTAGSSIVVGA